ncbi:DUF6165 family protein [Alphaproteobacteria bacterium]|nr:DUF6165 family protein [Alphaproteobacteria bacterium]
MIKVEISYGELFDKISILEIKKSKLNNPEEIIKVKYELNLLLQELNNSKINSSIISSLTTNLKEVNLKLWNIEDEIREKERNKKFDKDFIKLARDVYITNDKRAKIKNEINHKLNSKVFEVKSYKNY